MGGKGGGSAPSPDKNIGKAALMSAETGKEFLAFSKDAFKISNVRQAEIDDLTKQVTQQQMGLAQGQFDLTKQVTNEQMGLARDAAAQSKLVTDQQLAQSKYLFDTAKADRDRYETVYRPVEDQFVKEATAYGSEENIQAKTAEALADVRTGQENARATAARQAAANGVDPNSGRMAGIARAGEMQDALAQAGAQNATRTAMKDKALALKADVANMGRGLPAQSAAATQLGLGAGSSALGGMNSAAGLQLGTSSNGLASMGSAAGMGISTGNSALGNLSQANQQWLASTAIPGQGYQGAMSGYNQMGNLLNQQYGLQLDAWKTKQQLAAQESAGIGSALGSIAGMFSFTSDENAKQDKAPIEEGAALDAVNSMPVEEWTYKPGVADEGRHVGPYAQDFQAATGKGDGKSINAQDAIGITMKAVQDLSTKVDAIASQIGLGPAAKPKARKPVETEKEAA